MTQLATILRHARLAMIAVAAISTLSAQENPVVPVSVEILPAPPSATDPNTGRQTSHPAPSTLVTSRPDETSPASPSPSIPAHPQLTFPSPATISQPVPSGWKLETDEKAPVLTHRLELTPGNFVTLAIRPPVLVPATEEPLTFAIDDPGLSPALGSQQHSTTNAILTESIRQLQQNSQNLEVAISQLQQLLLSLPKPPKPLSPQPPSQP